MNDLSLSLTDRRKNSSIRFVFSKDDKNIQDVIKENLKDKVVVQIHRENNIGEIINYIYFVIEKLDIIIIYKNLEFLKNVTKEQIKTILSSIKKLKEINYLIIQKK